MSLTGGAFCEQALDDLAPLLFGEGRCGGSCGCCVQSEEITPSQKRLIIEILKTVKA